MKNNEEYIVTFDTASPEVCEELLERINEIGTEIMEGSF